MVLPLAGLVGAVALLWGRGIGWTDVGLFAGFYVLTAMGITIGFHRLLTHRSFETTRFIKALFAIAGSMAVQGSVFRWVATHRRHHQHSDEVEDPHSPHAYGSGAWSVLRGAWHAHIGWMLEPEPECLSDYIRDLQRDPLTKRISDLFVVWVALGMLIPAVIGGLVTMSWFGALTGFLWGGLVRILVVHHITWSINSICHIAGTQPYKTGDRSRNNAFFGILAFGEGWHNNHHAFPTSARHGLRWWQLDGSYLMIKTLAAIGLAWNVRVPGRESLNGVNRPDPAPCTPVAIAPLVSADSIPA